MPEFNSETEELEYLRYAVGHLIGGQGRETADASASLDYGWDLLEGYYKENLYPESE